ncbi:MAG: sorbosone dehydrogenase [Planctomycetaceae bacterium]|nr:sorbosone dehydrogenase [Planctomycetaceae bacterium]
MMLSGADGANEAAGGGLMGRIKLPPGFKIEVYAENVPKARSMALSESGVLFVGVRNGSRVYAVVDEDGDFRADRVHVIAEGLNSPNGVALRDGDLYVAEIHRVIRFDDIEKHLTDPPKPVVVNDTLPRDGHHGWKFIRFGPDGKLYVPVGAPCNICWRQDDERYASILRMNPDGSDLEVFAHGVRNTVGFDWHPKTRELWFTDNGRDNLGDDVPPDELNRAPKAGMHFGYPFRHGRGLKDPEFGERKPADLATTPAEQPLGSHVAALGMRFYTGKMFPTAYRGQIFIAEHGSWNRTDKIGYRISLVRLDKKGRTKSYEPFAEGFHRGDRVWGRPVDVEVMADGSMLVSDDYAGAIYRITYDETATTAPSESPTR